LCRGFNSLSSHHSVFANRKIITADPHGSFLLAFGAAKGFKLGFQRGPILAVFGLFSADFRIECLAKSISVAGQGMAKERAMFCERAEFRRKAGGQFEQTFLRTSLQHPKSDSFGGGRIAQDAVVTFDQRANDGPILLALCLLGLHQIFDGKEFESLAALVGNCGATTPKVIEARQVAQPCHDIDAQSVGFAAFAAKVHGMTPREDGGIESR
jgi:hypothetical protein